MFSKFSIKSLLNKKTLLVIPVLMAASAATQAADPVKPDPCAGLSGKAYMLCLARQQQN